MAVQSIDRTFDILELLAKNQSGMNLTEIGEVLDLHKSTVHRLLSSLKDRGYVEQGSTAGLYRLGLRFVHLTSSYLNGIELKTESESYLHALSNLLNQTVFLSVLQDNEVVYIDKYEQATGLRRYSIIGRRAPLYCTSLGKSLLLDKSDEVIRGLLKDVEFKKRTSRTIGNVDELIDDIRASRLHGWTKDDQENERGVQCMAAPIYDYRGMIIAAISTAWNMEFNLREYDKIAPRVVETALKISERLGFVELRQ
ncbi:MAG: IclR family transcriptional regulator [Spirochaetales bacterium]|nr:IclR family transcriptional regulator [Spirochaetales bacterium]